MLERTCKTGLEQKGRSESGLHCTFCITCLLHCYAHPEIKQTNKQTKVPKFNKKEDK